MQIKDLRKIVDTLSTVGIQEACMTPTDNGTVIRGTNKSKDIIIYHESPIDLEVDVDIAFLSAKVLKSRLDLFSDDATVEVIKHSDDDVSAYQLKLKEGRRNSLYTCADPEALVKTIPSKVPPDMVYNEETEIVMSGEFFEGLKGAIGSILSASDNKDETHISISCENHVATITISDGDTDSFTEKLEGMPLAECEASSWEVNGFKQVLSEVARSNKDSDISLSITTEYLTAIVILNDLEFILAPKH